jgi:hypothetical protein
MNGVLHKMFPTWPHSHENLCSLGEGDISDQVRFPEMWMNSKDGNVHLLSRRSQRLTMIMFQARHGVFHACLRDLQRLESPIQLQK